MQLEQRSGKLTSKDLITARALKVAPLAGFVAGTVPLPLLFFTLYLLSTESAAFYLLMTFSGLGVGAVVGLVLALTLYLYRRSWERRLRDRLASDGITVDELPFFTGELKTAERLALRRIETQNKALADAYRETLAARLTATQLLSKAKKELVRIDGRLARARQLRNADTTKLQKDLTADRERVKEIKTRAENHLGQAEAQLQTIEATSSRSDLRDGTDIVLQRLGSSVEHTPLALEAAQMEEMAREQVQAMVHEAELEDRGHN
jgi:hypothetical protein